MEHVALLVVPTVHTVYVYIYAICEALNHCIFDLYNGKIIFPL